MPLYDFKCEVCETVFERIVKFEERLDVKCECGGGTKVLIVPHRYIPFKEGWYEHIDKKPIYITSKKQLNRECESRGLTSIYGRDS